MTLCASFFALSVTGGTMQISVPEEIHSHDHDYPDGLTSTRVQEVFVREDALRLFQGI